MTDEDILREFFESVAWPEGVTTSKQTEGGRAALEALTRLIAAKEQAEKERDEWARKCDAEHGASHILMEDIERMEARVTEMTVERDAAIQQRDNAPVIGKNLADSFKRSQEAFKEMEQCLYARIAELETSNEKLRLQCLAETGSADAIHEIREGLKEAGVPEAAFIDDFVGNAVALWKQSEARVAAITARLRSMCEAMEKINEMDKSDIYFDGMKAASIARAALASAKKTMEK